MLHDFRDELTTGCPGASIAFVESVRKAYGILFEDDQTIPVNTQNVVNSDTADTIPAQLRTAQATAKEVETQQKELDALKKTEAEQVQNLRDSLAVASNDTQDAQGANQDTNQQGTQNATA